MYSLLFNKIFIYVTFLAAFLTLLFSYNIDKKTFSYSSVVATPQYFRMRLPCSVKPSSSSSSSSKIL